MTRAGPSHQASAHPKRPSGSRWGVLLGLAFAATCAYLSRVCLSAANTTIQRDLGFSPEQMGQILAAFSAGYFWFQIPGGALGTRWGTRLVLPLLSVWWSLSAVWTGLSVGIASFWTSRVMSGIAQAGLVPVSALAITHWFPLGERGVASSAVATCMSAGAVIATSLTTLLLPLVGWRWVLAIYAVVGFVWSALFYAGFRNTPEEHKGVSSEELRIIRGAPAPEGAEVHEPETRTPTPSMPGYATPKEGGAKVWWMLLTSFGMWMMCLQAFCRAFGAAFFITWFPAYLEKGRGVSMTQAGLLTTLPLIGTLLGNAMGGFIVDQLLIRTRSRRLSRSGTSVLALLLCAASIFAASLIRDPTSAVVVIALGSMCFGCGSPASWAAGMDLGGKHTSLLMAIQNMTGNLGALVCPMILGVLIGRIERTNGDWNQVLYVFVGIYAMGALFWALLDPNHSAVERSSFSRS